jgi:maleylpyruvate isomerase
MTTDRPITPALRGVGAAQDRLERVVDQMADTEVAQPSALPGWSRGHVLTHLARNADSQTAMLLGAQRGEIIDQYPGGDAQRSGDIEAGAGRTRGEIAVDLEAGHRRFLAAAEAMSDEAWERTTRPRAGERPAWATVWARWREVEVHLLDLGLGPDSAAAALSSAFVDAFLPGEMGQLPSRLPSGAAGYRVELEGAPSDQLLWLMGRPSGPVGLTVDGEAVAYADLVPWQQAMWYPGT